MNTPSHPRKSTILSAFAALLTLSSAWAGITAGSKNIGAVWFVGDSITQSNADGDANGSPRKSLYDLLIANGYTFTFTGHYTANVDGLPTTGGTAATNLYHYHSGISGSVIGDDISGRTGMTQNLTSFWSTGRLATVKPNVILIMLGTNDVDQNMDLANAPARLTTLVNTIYAQAGVGNPTVLIGSIPPNRTSAPADITNTAAFNAAVPGVVTAQQGLGRDVRFVDQFTPLDSAYASTMMGDNLHVNTTGNNTLAQQWFNRIDAIAAAPTPIYQTWASSAPLFILTTPEGTNLAATGSETNFPLLVRLNSGNFTFGEAQSDGRDVRFATVNGGALSYQIEQWDAVGGVASIWVKIPIIVGNMRQEIRMYWGKSGVTSESSGSNVFNAANGYASVLHMNETLTDSVGTVTPTNSGTSLTTGMIGKGRNFTSGNGINCGTGITSFPNGSNPHSSEAWFRATSAPSTLVGWGIEQGQGKVVMQLASPPHINMDCYFSGGNVTGASTLGFSQWVHVAHTYKNGEARLYVNGVQDGITAGGTTMAIPATARMYIGGWYDNYNFAGDMDEVRISKVTRSANWIKMEYENQKQLQTLVGSLVQTGATFSATPATVVMNEGATTTLNAQAGGAQKVYWISKKDGVETVLATDQFTLNVSAGRITGNSSFVIQFKAIYATETKTVDIPVTVTEDLPDPVFTLTGPDTWDGRQTIMVTPAISNLSALQAKNVANLTYNWRVAGVAVAKQITAGTPAVPGTLTLTRSQGSGPMTVTLVLYNGGNSVSSSKTITVQEPASDAWVQRTPGATEIPVTGQFFARDETGFGRIYYNGSQSGTPDSVFLKVYTSDAGDVLYSTLRQPLVGGKYAFIAPIAPGRVTYKVVYGTSIGGVDTPVGSPVSNLVCGDAYIIQGQSNAVATDGLPGDTTNDPWIRTYGQSGGGWGNAVRNGTQWWVGYWGYDLAAYLTTTYNMPICIINGAVGGTRIDQHQANPADHAVAGSSYSIYANLLTRVAGAKLTHGIRGVFWHQGESNSGADSPTGDWDYKSYQQYFVDMSAAWKQDFPNIQRYVLYQVWTNPCSMGGRESSDMLREVQRTLPGMYSRMHILSTVGLTGYLGCHYSAAGYQALADLTAPLVRQDFYGMVTSAAVTAPNLKLAYFTSGSKNEIALEFDQNMSWNNFSKVNFYLDRVGGKVISGSASGKVVKLQLSAATTAQTIDYVVDQYWDGSSSNLLYGTNAIAALTFYAVPIAATNVPKDILTFVFPGFPATTISGTNISVSVPSGTAVTALAPTYTMSVGANGSPVSGTSRNFTTAQTYTVTGSDDSTQVYTVTVNHTPAASPQTVSTAEDTPKAITLAADDSDGNTLIYAIVTPPAHGALSGQAPNVTYTPASNYNGPDSFTFKANDGFTDSAAATVSLTVTPVNDAPVAAAQSVSVGQNATKAITLQAADAEGASLTYVIVAQPVHGALGGTPPSVIYTPDTGYGGVDSFTFKANDGVNDSAAATVSITLIPVSYTWQTGVKGNWSDSTKWTSGSPASGGNEAYILSFNVAGIFTSTNDLSAGFLLNQLNFGGSTATLAGNSLTFSAVGSVLPQVNQNGAAAASVGNNLVLAATTTVGGVGAGALSLSGAISGVGGLTINSSSQVNLSGTNTYTGPTIIQAGILRVSNPVSLYNAALADWTPANITVASGATLRVYCGAAAYFTPAQAGTLFGNLTTVNHNGLLAGSFFGFDTFLASSQTTIATNLTDSSGPGGGAVGLKKFTTGTLLLSGVNTYSGKTFIDAGVLSVSSLNSVNGGSPPLANSSLGRPTTVATGTIDFGNSASITTAAGLIYTGTGETTDRVMNLAGQTATYTIDQSGTGPLKFTRALSITGTGYNKTLALKGSTAGTGEIAGSIIDPAVGKTTGLIKSGTGIWKLTGANSHTGATQIQAGTLVCDRSAALGGGTLDITTGAKLELNFSGTRQVAALTFNAGSAQPNGTYGSTASPATNKNDALFAGTGTVTVGPVATLQYTLTVSASPSNGGSAVGAGLFNEGSLQTITATTNNGWQFTGWTGSGITAPDAASTTVLVDGDKTVTANFSELNHYVIWASASAQGLTAGVNDGPNDDPDHDGITNLLEFTLGGSPKVSSQAILPVLTKSAGVWIFEYDRHVLSLAPATTQIVEYGDDLTGWTAVTIPEMSNGMVSVTPGSPSDHVRVTLPVQGGKGYVRLKVSQ